MNNPQNVQPGTTAEPTPVAEKLAQSAHDAIDRASETVSSAEQSIRQGAAVSEQRARELGVQAQVASDQTIRDVKSYMREHPLESLGIAFVSGVVLSSLMRR